MGTTKNFFLKKSHFFNDFSLFSQSTLYSILKTFPHKIQSIRMSFAKNFIQALT